MGEPSSYGFERSYRRVLALYCLVVGGVFCMLPCFSPNCRSRMDICLGTAIAFVAVALLNIPRLLQLSRKPKGSGGIFQWQPHARLKEIWPLIRIAYPIIFPALTVITANRLLALETEQRGKVLIWFITADLYEHFGFWPTVIFFPVLGLLLLLALLLKVRRTRESVSETEAVRAESAVGPTRAEDRKD